MFESLKNYKYLVWLSPLLGFKKTKIVKRIKLPFETVGELWNLKELLIMLISTARIVKS